MLLYGLANTERPSLIYWNCLTLTLWSFWSSLIMWSFSWPLHFSAILTLLVFGHDFMLFAGLLCGSGKIHWIFIDALHGYMLWLSALSDYLGWRCVLSTQQKFCLFYLKYGCIGQHPKTEPTIGWSYLNSLHTQSGGSWNRCQVERPHTANTPNQ